MVLDTVGSYLWIGVMDLWRGVNDAAPVGAFIRAAVFLTVGHQIVKLVDSVFGIGIAVGKRVKGGSDE